MRNLLLIIISLSILWTSNVFAAEYEPWDFSIVPYFWAVNIDGDIEVGVPAEGVENQLLHLSENFLGIWDHVHNGGMLDINATKGKFGLFFSAMYVSIKNIDVTTSDGFEVLVNSKFGLFTAGAFYRGFEWYISHCSKARLGPYFGARYTKNESGAGLIEAPEYNASYETHWTEPIVGATLLFDLNQYWAINLAADVGFLNRNQDSYNIIGLIECKPTKHLGIYLGYRELYQSITEGSGQSFFEWKMHVGGPILGIAFRF